MNLPSISFLKHVRIGQIIHLYGILVRISVPGANLSYDQRQRSVNLEMGAVLNKGYLLVDHYITGQKVWAVELGGDAAHLVADVVSDVVGQLAEERMQDGRLRKCQALDVGVILA
jgi:hypothetical protein